MDAVNHYMRDPRERSRPGHGVGVLACALTMGGAAVLAGCQQPLFSDRYSRTQFDRYDRSRNQFARPYVEDEFGRKEPNLWGRLSPKE